MSNNQMNKEERRRQREEERAMDMLKWLIVLVFTGILVAYT